MIEKVILEYLSEELNVPVSMQAPENKTEKYVVLEKTGSSQENHLCTAMFAIQSYAGSLIEAAELNETVKQAMFDAITLSQITRVYLNSDYNFTDESTKRPRYQAVFEITHYE